MGTNANGYEIRLTLLQMAKDMAYEKWHNTQNAAFHNAQHDHTPVVPAEPPSFAEIEELAGKLYGFVQKSDAAPRRESCKMCNASFDRLKHTHDHKAAGLNRYIGQRPLRNPSLPDDDK